MQQTLEQIKMLNLTEGDFNLLIDGLDSLPEKGLAGEFLGDMLTMALSKDDDEEKKMKQKFDIEKRRKDREKEKIQVKENVKILQGKLLMLKRYMQENALLKEAYDVIDIPTR